MAQALPGYETMFQFVEKLVIGSIAGFAASDVALAALATLAGSWPASSRGFAAETASLAVLSLKAVPIASNIHPGALSRLSSDAFSNRASVSWSSDSSVVTTPAPFLYASAASLLTRGSASTGAEIIRSCSGCRLSPTLMDTSASRSSMVASKGRSLSGSIVMADTRKRALLTLQLNTSVFRTRRSVVASLYTNLTPHCGSRRCRTH